MRQRRCLAVLLLLASTSPCVMVRLLCLHGKGNTADTFRDRVKPLAKDAELVCVSAPHPLGDGFAWWHLPPGERSFTTPVFEGWPETLDFIRKVWTEEGPFDGMLGFSQGAILVAALVALGEMKSGRALASCRCLLLCGAAVPGPFQREIADLASRADKLENGNYVALHTIGRQDDINPPEGARQVAAAVGGEIFEFDGGHDVPMDEAALEVYRSLLKRLP
ncbi:unnamed protein product [Cladocopium goreaui]|uniref:UPF0483 protein n=1 Tax=Cladocopium goreaui TaxID=2562237 RepID=A0A9P1FIY0_9DINO|nr:unnamed protein product [Cladocopium goreaui]